MKNLIQNTAEKIHQLLASLAVILILAHTGFLQAQAPNIEWQKSFGGSEDDRGQSVLQTTDGGYFVVGGSRSNNGDVTGNNGLYDFWVTKLNATGVIEWQDSFGGPGNDRAYKSQQTVDGGYIVMGYNEANGGDVTGNHGGRDIWVIKISPSGQLQWQRSYGGSEEDTPGDIRQTQDGGYILAGSTRSNDGDVSGNHGGEDVWVLKINDTGSIQWQKTYGGTSSDRGETVFPTSDGGYIVGGSSNSNNGDVTGNHGGRDIWVIKISLTGQLQWQKSYGGSEFEVARKIIQTTDAGYIIGGYTRSNDGDVSGNNGMNDCWVLKLNSSGTLQWQKVFGGSDDDSISDIHQTSDNGFVFIGSASSNNGDVTNNHGEYDYWVGRLNSAGDLQWQKSYGGTLEDLGRSMQLTSDGGFILAGDSRSNDGDVSGNHGDNDFWVVKLSPDPLEVPEFDENKIVLYPNPVIENIQIKASESIEKITLFNLQGQKLFEQSPNTFQAEINIGTYSKGIYLVQVTSNKHTTVYKLIKK